MTRAYSDRDPEQKEKVRANSRRYARTPVGILRRRARVRAMYALKAEQPERYRELFDKFMDRLLDELEGQSGEPS